LATQRPPSRRGSYPTYEDADRRWGDPVLVGSTMLSALAFAGITVAVSEAGGATVVDLWLLDVLTQELVTSLPRFDWLTLAASPHTFEAAFLALFVYFGVREAWRKAYLSLALGPGGSALVYLVQVGIQRVPPGGAPGRMVFSNYPNATAALAPLLVLTLLLLFGRRLGTGSFLGGVLAGSLYPLIVSVPDLYQDVWPTDLLAGNALGVAWFGACLAGYVVVTGGDLPDFGNATARDRRHLGPTIDRWLRAARRALLALARRLASHLYQRRTLHVLVAAGVLVRVSTFWTYQIGFDANVYAVTAEAISRGSLEMPWGAVYSLEGTPAPSHHYPPLYPAYLAGFYAVFGVSAATTQVASIVASLALLVVVYACTRDLYDADRALATTAVLALYPVLIKTTGEAYSENLVLVTFTLTMWSILRSLEEPRYIVPAGLFAGLGYLTKSSMGYFFFLAGAAGFCWRLYWMGRELFEDRHYWAAVGVFGTIVAAWAGRNWIVHGTWQTSEHLAAAYHHALAHPGAYVASLPVVFLFLLGLGYLVQMGVLPWFPWLSGIPVLEDEHDSGLWLAIGLPLVLTAFVYTALWIYEDFFYHGAVRYLAPALIPLCWLVLRHVDLEATTVRLAATTSLLLLAGASAVYAVPYQPLYDDAPEDLGERHDAGEAVAFAGLDGHGTYRFYLDLTDGGAKDIDVRPLALEQVAQAEATWLVTKGHGVDPPSGYEIVDQYRTHEPRLESIVVWRNTEPG